MRTGGVVHQNGVAANEQVVQHTIHLNIPRKTVIASILLVALVAFEVFNFDTTRYALQDLLGGVTFLGVSWAAILAIAFCAIDFAGLARLFTPERGKEEPKAVWYLMGAWLLGATMNAIMTWWAISLNLLAHQVGNEILSQQQLLQIVPVFVAALVWLTRILFIGAFSVAGGHLFDLRDEGIKKQAKMSSQPVRETEIERPIPAPPVIPAEKPHQPPAPLPLAPKQAPTGQRRAPQRPPIPPAGPSPVPMRADNHL